MFVFKVWDPELAVVYGLMGLSFAMLVAAARHMVTVEPDTPRIGGSYRTRYLAEHMGTTLRVPG